MFSRNLPAIAMIAFVMSAQAAATTISVSDSDFLINDKPTTLSGYGFYGAVADRQFKQRVYLNKLADSGINYTRVWQYYQWPQDGLMPNVKTNKGYRLRKTNQELIKRMTNFVKKADKLGIAVEVVLGPETVGIEDGEIRWDVSWANPNNVAEKSKKLVKHLEDKQQQQRMPAFFNLHKKKSKKLYDVTIAPAVTAMAKALAPYKNVIYGISQELEEDGHFGKETVVSYTRALANTVYNAVKDTNPDPVFVFNVGSKGSPLYKWATNGKSSKGWEVVIRDHIHSASKLNVWSGSETHPLILSNDGDTDTMYVDPTLSFAEQKEQEQMRLAEITALANAAALKGDAFEALDKNFWGSSWGEKKYLGDNNYFNKNIAQAVVDSF